MSIKNPMEEVPDGHESKQGITLFQSSDSLPGLNSPRVGSPRSPRQVFPRVPLARRLVWRESGARAHILTQEALQKNGVGSTPMWPNWEPGVTSLRFCRAPGRTQRIQPEERQGEMARRSLRPGLTSRPRAEPGSRRGAEPGSQRRPYLYSWAWRQRPAGGVRDGARADGRNGGGSDRRR